ncbi:hypothetical protein HYH03_010298 [Edaphochlamys debaryana]|uniref:Replication protein A subunit n=1 Tax=Edaphochlamys debaryana TaxID=47281 RepID=A0A836BWS6_9CHLO|nr:hypothetical protein HYH03_010298 [Edaphochlamys debaryana]|eukprot:KAG2491292.1 hypothetical protein HYH03_010298 [Edaphochlamys debaryana]
MQAPQLSAGVLMRVMQACVNQESKVDVTAILQVLELKQVPNKDGKGNPRYRIRMADGQAFLVVMGGSSVADIVNSGSLVQGSIVEVKDFVINDVGGKKMYIALATRPLEEYGLFATPIMYPPTTELVDVEALAKQQALGGGGGGPAGGYGQPPPQQHYGQPPPAAGPYGGPPPGVNGAGYQQQGPPPGGMYGGPPPPVGGGNGAPPGANNPYGAPPPGNSNPYGAPPPANNNPYGAPPPAANNNPYGGGGGGGGNPYGAPPPGSNPYGGGPPAGGNNPYGGGPGGGGNNPYGGGPGGGGNNPYGGGPGGGGGGSRPPTQFGGHGAVARDEAPPRFMPISMLNPYTARWAIRARVTSKGELRRWTNVKGEGKVFSFDLLDRDGGEIRATAFGAEADKFFEVIEAGQVYQISKASLNPKRAQFNHLNHQYEIRLDRNSQVERIAEDPETSQIPAATYHFKKIIELESAEAGSVHDLVGVVESCDAWQTITRKTGEETQKRSLVLRDDSGRSIELTLWGPLVNNPGDTIEQMVRGGARPVLVAKAVRVGDFNGKSLSTVGASVLRLDPMDLQEVQRLRQWYDAGGRTQVVAALTGAGGGGGGRSDRRCTFQAIKDERLGTGPKPDWTTVSAVVDMVKTDDSKGGPSAVVYPACPHDFNGRSCQKKMMDIGGGNWNCERCGYSTESPAWRYMVSMSACDHTGKQFLTAFGDAGDQLFGRTAPEMRQLEVAGGEGFERAVESVRFAPYIFRLKVAEDTYNDEQRIKVSIFKLDRLTDYAKECGQMLTYIRALEAGQPILVHGGPGGAAAAAGPAGPGPMHGGGGGPAGGYGGPQGGGGPAGGYGGPQGGGGGPGGAYGGGPGGGGYGGPQQHTGNPYTTQPATNPYGAPPANQTPPPRQGGGSGMYGGGAPPAAGGYGGPPQGQQGGYGGPPPGQQGGGGYGGPPAGYGGGGPPGGGYGGGGGAPGGGYGGGGGAYGGGGGGGPPGGGYAGGYGGPPQQQQQHQQQPPQPQNNFW